MPAEVATSDELAALEKRVTDLEPVETEPPVPEEPSETVDMATRAELDAVATDVADLTGRVETIEQAPIPPGTGSAYVGLPSIVVNTPTDGAVQAGIKAWLASRGTGQFPKAQLLFTFIGTANLTTPLLPADTGLIQGARWKGMGKRGTVLRWMRSDVPLLTSWGQLRNWLFDDVTLQAGVPGAKGFYLRSDNGKTNQDGMFRLIEWMGPWDYGIGLDGKDSTANLNSEIVFDRPALSNDASFATAWFWCGMTPGVTQQNQFLNYTIRDSKLEGSHGDYLRFDYGGSIQVEGFNSWIHTGQAAADKIPRGRMIYFPRGNNGDSVMFLDVRGLRPELRSQQSKLIDSAWSNASRITFDTLRSTPNAFRVPDFESMTFRGDAGVDIRNSYLHGHIGLRGSARPRMILDNTAAAGNQNINYRLVHPGTQAKAQDANGAWLNNGIVRTYDTAKADQVLIR
jgi:hypothetical protein